MQRKCYTLVPAPAMGPLRYGGQLLADNALAKTRRCTVIAITLTADDADEGT